MMKIVVDLKRCEGNERGAAAAPEVFEVRNDPAQVLIENPPAGLMEKVKLAIRLCPRQAIFAGREIEYDEDWWAPVGEDHASTGR
jgi:ferredoxin